MRDWYAHRLVNLYLGMEGSYFMMFIRIFLLTLLSVSSLSTYSLEGQTFSIKQDVLKNILQTGGFSGAIDETAELEYIGYMHNDSIGFHVYYYSREFGESHRLTQRLIFISTDNKYIGMFAVNDKPVSVNRDQVLFEYEDDVGNVIRLTDKGVPQEAYLDGEVVEIFK